MACKCMTSAVVVCMLENKISAIPRRVFFFMIQMPDSLHFNYWKVCMGALTMLPFKVGCHFHSTPSKSRPKILHMDLIQTRIPS